MIPKNRRRRAARHDPTERMTEAEKLEHKNKLAGRTPISEMGLPARVVNGLEGLGLIVCEQVMQLSRAELIGIKNFGEKTIRELMRAVRRLGLAVPEIWRPSRKKRPRQT